MSFRDNLQHLRATRNMTQEQLAMLLGVSRQSVSKWEAERAYPEMDKLLQLCDLFGCTLDELVTGDVTARPIDGASGMSSAKAPQDVTGYDHEMRTTTGKISLGVALPILAVSLAFLVTDFMSAPGAYSWSYEGVIVIIGIVVGLSLILPAVSSRRSFRKGHPFVEDFYTTDQKNHARSIMTKTLVAGIGSIMIGLGTTLLPQATPWLSASLFSMAFALGVFLIFYGYLFSSRCNLASYNKKSLYSLNQSQIDALEDEKLQIRARQAKRNKGTYVIVMLAATVVAIILMFFPLLAVQRMFPIAWWIGILVCIAIGVYRSSRSGD